MEKKRVVKKKRLRKNSLLHSPHFLFFSFCIRHLFSHSLFSSSSFPSLLVFFFFSAMGREEKATRDSSPGSARRRRRNAALLAAPLAVALLAVAIRCSTTTLISPLAASFPSSPSALRGPPEELFPPLPGADEVRARRHLRLGGGFWSRNRWEKRARGAPRESGSSLS